MSSKFSLLTNAMPTFTKKTTVEAKVDALTDYQVQLLEYLRYTLSNLDVDNFNPSGLNEILEPVVVEIKNTDGDILDLWITAEELAAQIEDADGKYTSISATVNGIQSTVSGHTTTINSHTDSIKSHGNSIVNLQSQITQTANEIAAVVSAVDDSSGKVTAASIVAAINATTGSSMVKIEADHILMTGTTKFVSAADLGAGGTTEIDGGRIVSGVIEGIEFKTSGTKLEEIVIADNEIEFGGQAKIYKVPTEEADEFYLGYEEGLHLESVTPVYVGSRNGPTNIIVGNSRERVYFTFTANAIYVHNESKNAIGRVPIEWE